MCALHKVPASGSNLEHNDCARDVSDIVILPVLRPGNLGSLIGWNFGTGITVGKKLILMWRSGVKDLGASYPLCHNRNAELLISGLTEGNLQCDLPRVLIT
jgi:hypothetical protein